MEQEIDCTFDSVRLPRDDSLEYSSVVLWWPSYRGDIATNYTITMTIWPLANFFPLRRDHSWIWTSPGRDSNATARLRRGAVAEEYAATFFERAGPSFKSHSGRSPVRRNDYPVADTFMSQTSEIAEHEQHQPAGSTCTGNYNSMVPPTNRKTTQQHSVNMLYMFDKCYNMSTAGTTLSIFARCYLTN
uniref:Uncharacterized protein n=1 Tax=Anopheles culicifacies TaxID=139723 RepID=A0A182MAB8_9DIPT